MRSEGTSDLVEADSFQKILPIEVDGELMADWIWSMIDIMEAMTRMKM